MFEGPWRSSALRLVYLQWKLSRNSVNIVFCCVYISLNVGRSVTKFEIQILPQLCVQAETPRPCFHSEVGPPVPVLWAREWSEAVVVGKCRGQRLRQTWQLQGRRTRRGGHIYSSALLWIRLPGARGCRARTPSPTHPPIHPSTCLSGQGEHVSHPWSLSGKKNCAFLFILQRM